MITKINKDAVRRRIHTRIRKRVEGSPARPRLAVFRSIKHIYVQVIDDLAGKDGALRGNRRRSRSRGLLGTAATGGERHERNDRHNDLKVSDDPLLT